MADGAYNRRDIPRELRRLLDSTDRGIEQLYHLAGRGAAASASPMVDDDARAAVPRTRRRREWMEQQQQQQQQQPAARGVEVVVVEPPRRHVYAERHRSAAVPSASTRVRGTHASSFSRHHHDTDDTYSATSDSGDDERGSAEEEGQHVGTTDNYTDAAAAAARHRERRPHRGAAAHTDRPRRDGGHAPPPGPRPGDHPRDSPHSCTPHRTLDLSAGTAFSSPASLAQPPSRGPHRADLHPPPSALYSTGSTPPPPWRQRQQRGGTLASPFSAASASALHNSYTASSSSSPTAGAAAEAAAAEAAAYRAHVAAQQSTQRPHSGMTSRERRRRTVEAAQAGPVASPFTSPGSAQSRSRDVSVHHSGRGDVVTNGGAAESASSGMLSRFGRRWGGVFQDMLTDVTPPPPPPPQQQQQQQQQRQQWQQQTSPPSRSASSAASVGDGGYTTGHRDGAGDTHAPYTRASAKANPVSTETMAVAAVSVDARLGAQLQAELQAREEAMLQLRMDHARELAEVRQAAVHERTDAARRTADEVAASCAVKQQLLQSSLQTERERVAESEEQLRLARREAAQRKLDLEDTTHALTTLQARYAALTSARDEEAAQASRWRAQAEAAAATAAQLESQVKVWKAREVDWQAREAQLQQHALAAEERREQQETAAQTALAQVEAEFTNTSHSYQDVLAEATRRMSHLEKAHRRYKLLKDANAALKAECEQLVDSAGQRARDAEVELASARAEVAELRQQLRQRDSVAEQQTTAHQEMLADYKRRLELQEASAADQARTLQQHVDTANHTVELLRAQVEGLKHTVLEEQAQHQQAQMSAAQAELQWKEAQHEQQRSAAAYKVRTEDTIAQLKRQLREKDAKMQALAANAAEPVERLRRQLDDERGRRARLEEEFRGYKKKAKEAEEQAASEMRREQLRTAVLPTPAAAAVPSPPLRRTRSATATPSPPSSATAPRRGGSGGAAPAWATRADGVSLPIVQVSASRSHGSRVSRPGGARAPAAGAAAVHGAASEDDDDDSEGGSGRRRTRTAVVPRRTPSPAGAVSAERDTTHVRRSVSPPHADATTTPVAAPDASAISPNATVESISGILAASPSTANLIPSVPETEARVARPWAANVPAPITGAVATTDPESAAATRAYAGAGVQAHEQRMSAFHVSASEVLRRIAGSREEFLLQCAAIVKNTAAAATAAGHRGAPRRSRRVVDVSEGDEGAAAAAEPAESETEHSNTSSDDGRR
ncbi:hypothetical protein NESM_000288700 [Novymonas esmeraldas]|uniref:Uncharacterized protein n=1 Tax=Novymonas esmeraldas TaxID=1808958 RepID=A0AAW0F9P7_9TRYP